MTPLPALCFHCDRILSAADCAANGVPHPNGGREAAAQGPRCLCDECCRQLQQEKDRERSRTINPFNNSLYDCVAYGQTWPQHQWTADRPNQPTRQTCANCLMTVTITSAPRIY